jgi:glycosyltransferase involved in cell wall biosynthesis
MYANPLLNAIQRAAWTTIGFPIVRGADAVVTYNARVHSQLEEGAGRHIHFIGNGVDVERFRPRSPESRRATRRSFGLPEDGTLALFAGRESQKKNLDVLLSARRDAYTLVVCGAERNLSAPGLVDLGIVPYDRMAELFACVDLMVHPASGEGFPLAVQESVASGVPVVLLWDEGYARWMPRDFVGACDSVSEIVPCVEALASDGDARARMAASGREWALAHWSWDSTITAYEQVYREVLDGVHRA